MRFHLSPLLFIKSLCLISIWLVMTPFADAQMTLPTSIKKALQSAEIPESALGFNVIQIGKNNPQTNFGWQATNPMNPASTMKLVTTIAALDILGPQYRWKTQLFGTGAIDHGVYSGDLIWQGFGDPKFVPEELSTMMASLRELGINEINGHLIFDRSAYAANVKESAPLDGDSSRSYNVSPDPLLYAFQTLSFKISSTNGQTEISYTPHLSGLHVQNLLKGSKGVCKDWTKTVKTSIRQLNENEWRATFIGKFSENCPDVTWNVVSIEPNQFLQQGIMAAWEEAGGKWRNIPTASEGTAPSNAKLLISHQGIFLSDAIKDTNKFSNNVMARQIFLTLGLEKGSKPVTTYESIRVTKEWLNKVKLDFPELVIENGSGLSNIERISPQSMSSLLQFAAYSKNNDVFINSLPIAGVDGTMKHRLLDRLRKVFGDPPGTTVFVPDKTVPATLQQPGAFIKTGTLQSVRSVAGYVVSKTGKVYAVSSIVNHANAALGGSNINDAVLSWVLEDCPKD